MPGINDEMNYNTLLTKKARTRPILIPETTPGERKGERVLEVRGILWGDTLYKV
ncbi:MAG: hypothetical protein GXP49_16035, partial [Deltaproteobacteria bacterium]|nr:hypothetical protein [Deltaproteobacteria bacterium]